jgi:hypothetical protein
MSEEWKCSVSMFRKIGSHRGYGDYRQIPTPIFHLCFAVLWRAANDMLAEAMPKSSQLDTEVIRERARAWLYEEGDEEPWSAAWCADIVGLNTWEQDRKILIRKIAEIDVSSGAEVSGKLWGAERRYRPRKIRAAA